MEGEREREEGGGKREERSEREREIYTCSCMREFVTILHNTALV